MTENQYRTALKGIEEDLRVARRLGCKMVIKRLQQSKIKLLKNAVKPTKSDLYTMNDGRTVSLHNYYF